MPSITKPSEYALDRTARRLAEDSLRSSEQNLRLIVNSIPGYVCALTASGEIEFVNNQVLEYFGKTLDELKNWAVSDSVYPDDLPDVIATMRTSMETGKPTEVELRLRRADGIYRWFLLRRLPQRDSDGHLVRWYTLHTDIEDRKRAETSLRSSEQNFRLIVNSIPGYVYAVTVSGEIEFANNQVLEYFGKTIDELKNWATSDIVYPDDVAGLVAKVRTSDETGDPTEVELRLRRANGIYRWFCYVACRKLIAMAILSARIRCSPILKIESKRRTKSGEARRSFGKSWISRPKTSSYSRLIAIALVCMPIKRRSIILGSPLRSGGIPIFASTCIQVIGNA